MTSMNIPNSTARNNGQATNAQAIKDAARGRWKDILSEVGGLAGELLDGKQHPCPKCGGTNRFHTFEDTDETGSVRCRKCHDKAGDGFAVLQWLTGCEFKEALANVAKFLGLDAAVSPSKTATERRIVATYDYRDESGDLLFQVVRYDPKDFRQRQPKPDGGWNWRVKGLRVIPYRLPELLAEPSRGVVIVEGEKDADSLAQVGILATCNATGAEKWTAEHSAFLRGRAVAILPDNDESGRNHAEQVARSLYGVAKSVRVVELPGLPEKGDVTDWIAAGGTKAELGRLIDATPTWTPSAAASEVINQKPAAVITQPYEPFPVEALPEPLRGFVVAGAKAIGCDMSFVALPLLAVMANSIGTTRRVQLKRGWAAPAILWVAIVGESGSSKTPAFRLVMRSIQKRQRKALERHAKEMEEYLIKLSHHEKAHSEWKRNKKSDADPPLPPEAPPAERYMVSDVTIEALAPILMANPRGVLLSRDELAGWFGSFDRYSGGKGGADAAHWLSTHVGESITVDRKTGFPRTIYVPQAAVCVCGGIQPAILHRALGSEHRESGLAARILLTCPPRSPKRWTEADVDPKCEAEIGRIVDRLYQLEPNVTEDGEKQPVVIGLTAAAKSVWKSYYNDHAQEQAELTGDLSAAWSKLEEYAARIALVIHFVRWAAGDTALENANAVDVISMESGIWLANWFKNEARRVYSILGETDQERDRRRLVEWIGRRAEPVTAREVQMGCRWLRESGMAEAALEALVKIGVGHWEPTPAGQCGQPTRWFRLAESSVVNVNSISVKPEENANTVDQNSEVPAEVHPDADERSAEPNDVSVNGTGVIPAENVNTVDVDTVDVRETQQVRDGWGEI